MARPPRVAFSEEHQSPTDIGDYRTDSRRALIEYFAPSEKSALVRFAGYSKETLAAELDERLEELDRTVSLSLLASLEAAFRMDYLEHIYAKRRRSPLYGEFKKLYDAKGDRVSLEEDILNVWREHVAMRRLFSDLKGALKYRHWLAHGRYWRPKMGRQRYDYESLYDLCERVGALLSS